MTNNSNPTSATIPAFPGDLGGKAIEALNSDCYCVSLDQDALGRALESEIGQPGLSKLLRERCQYLFSSRPVFVSQPHLSRMRNVVAAIERVVALPAYREEVLSHSPAIARFDGGGAQGVFFSYDFHVANDDFGLIEINTNAGGAMLNAVLARAHHACCIAAEGLDPPGTQAASLESRIVAMFRHEWSLCGRTTSLGSIAIVDDSPASQYLYPEFVLFQRLFERNGLRAVIVDPSELHFRDNVLWHGDRPIDLIYNRLTDFALEDPAHAAIREAYLQGNVVLTPHPQAHALFADKRNLAILSDPKRLEALGVNRDVVELLVSGIPRTEVVMESEAERLWRDRRTLFFKPFAGFGGRAAYRGDKLTRRVWEDILSGGYVSQALIAPGKRALSAGPAATALKFDLRNYTYGGEVQWVAARLYQGQTTNFRTANGGFAPVYAIDPMAARCECPDPGA